MDIVILVTVFGAGIALGMYISSQIDNDINNRTK